MPISFCVSRRRFLSSCAALAAASTGCGTLLHPERRGQPAGDLDWGIVALDAIGLFFFFIPGVIAFAVDFSNGTIYLPPRERYIPLGASPDPKRTDVQSLQKVSVPRSSLTREGIAEAVSQHSGRPVKLRAGEYETAQLATVDQFWPALEERVANSPR